MKRFFGIILSFCLVFSLTGCSKNSTEKTSIVTSCYPIYIMTLNITKNIDNIQVSNMCDISTGCLHNFQLRSEDLKKIENSSFFIINGAGMETFLDKILKESPDIKIIDSSNNINLICEDCHHDDICSSHEHSHNHEYNSHIWLSISNYIQQVKNITQELSRLDTNNSEKYQKNSEEYISKLENLKTEVHNKLDGILNKKIVTFHEAFPYFAQEFGLEICGVINHEPEDEPSIKELKEIIEIIKENNIRSIFVEPQYSQTSANVISQETNAKIYVLDPAVTGDETLNSYINTMKKNAEILTEALK